MCFHLGFEVWKHLPCSLVVQQRLNKLIVHRRCTNSFFKNINSDNSRGHNLQIICGMKFWHVQHSYFFAPYTKCHQYTVVQLYSQNTRLTTLEKQTFVLLLSPSQPIMISMPYYSGARYNNIMLFVVTGIVVTLLRLIDDD